MLLAGPIGVDSSNYCEAAQELVSYSVLENTIEVATVCEKYKGLYIEVWITDKNRKAAIWTGGNRTIEESMEMLESGFTRVEIGSISGTKPHAERLVMDANDLNPRIISGNFNAWNEEYREMNARGSSFSA